MSYILLREANIANTRNESVTLGNSEKCNSFINFKFTYKAMSESCSLASHTFHRERKGLVPLQLPSCC